jgi:hypothetical protein
MATEMVLVPNTRYDSLITKEQEYDKKVLYYETLLLEKGAASTHHSTAKTSDHSNEVGPDKASVTEPNDTKHVDDDDNDDKSPIDSKQHSPMSIIDQFRTHYQLYGKRLLEYVKRKGGSIISWRDNGVIIYKGQAIIGSHIITLVEYIFKRRGSTPSGIKQFRRAMREISVPKAYLKPFLLNLPGIPDQIKKNWTKY